MLLGIFLYPVIFLILLLPRSTDEGYADDTSRRQKHKLQILIRELVRDVNLKVKSVNHLKRTYYNGRVFQTGQLIFDMRRKYTRMRFLYDLGERQNMSKKIESVVECESLALDIDKLVDMVEENEWKKKKRSETHDKFKLILRTKEHNLEEQKKKRDALRTKMAKIMNIQKNIAQKQKHMEDGFDTD